jgi:hypothetical protein
VRLDDVRAAIEAFVSGKEGAAKHEIERAEKRLSGLKGEQQKLLQLSYKGLVNEDVLTLEQARIRKEQHEVGRWKAVAEQDSEDVRRARDEALKLLEEAPNAYERATPEVRRLMNHAIWKRFWVSDKGAIVRAELQDWAEAVTSFQPDEVETLTAGSIASGLGDQVRRVQWRRRSLGLTNVLPAAPLVSDAVRRLRANARLHTVRRCAVADSPGPDPSN